MKHIALAILLVFGMGTQAQAFFIEPFANYATGENPEVNNSEYTSIELGARIGGSTLGFLYGLEYATSTGDYEAGATEQDLDTTDIGITIGYDFPIMVRAYATYFFSSEADLGTSEYEGSGGTRIGLGFTTLPFVNINVEMHKRVYDELNGGSLASDVELDGYSIGISIPLP